MWLSGQENRIPLRKHIDMKEESTEGSKVFSAWILIVCRWNGTITSLCSHTTINELEDSHPEVSGTGIDVERYDS
jgi:hypothetical protein